MKITKDTIATLTAQNFLFEDTIEEIQNLLNAIVVERSVTASEVMDDLYPAEQSEQVQEPANSEVALLDIEPNEATCEEILHGRHRDTTDWINKNCEVVYQLLGKGISANDVSRMLGKHGQYLYSLMQTDDEFTRNCKSAMSADENWSIPKTTTVRKKPQCIGKKRVNINRQRPQPILEWIEKNKEHVYKLLETGWTMCRISEMLGKRRNFLNDLLNKDDDFTRHCVSSISKWKAKKLD